MESLKDKGGEKEVKDLEKKLKNDFKSNLQNKNKEKEKEANEAKQRELKGRMERIHQKLGKTAMPRSMKKKVKRES